MNLSNSAVVLLTTVVASSSDAFAPPTSSSIVPSSRSSSSSVVVVVVDVPRRRRRHRRSRARGGTSMMMMSSSVAPSQGSANDDGAKRTTKTTTTTTSAADTTKRYERSLQIRREGGPLAFDTKFGALNPFAIYYGLVSIGLGLVWFAALTLCEVMYKITGGRVDTRRRIPVFLSHVWGTLLMLFTGCFPKIENGNIVRDFHKSGRKAMFVSNHNSWMDIPFIGHAIGWHNYKFVAKKELEKVPILGKAIKVAKNVLVDRTDRKSQLLTLKQGIAWLDDGVNLCTFPEGTRSRSGHLMPFKNGAFKMAHKAGAPVIPMSIVGAASVMPSHWMFPYKPAGFGACKVVVHEPVESKGKTEEELASAVRESIISGLPEEQRPLVST